MKRFVLFIVLMPVLFTACEDFINLKPLDQISMDDYWKTTTDLEFYTSQFYPRCFSQSQMVADMALHSDDMVAGSPNSIMNGERTRSTGNWNWEWRTIRDVNVFFENYHRCEDDFDSYKHYVGEAHFFRAWFYFELVKKYGDLPWYSTVLQLESEEELMKPRAPRTQVVDSILADINKAISYLSIRNTVGNSRLNKEAALAFKTRVALFEATWQKYHAGTVFATSGADPAIYFRQVIEAAEELMKGDYRVGIYTTGDPDQDYFRLFGFDNMSDIDEVLLYRAFNAADGLGNSTQAFVTYNADQRGITWELVSSYLGKNGMPYDYIELSRTFKGNDFLLKIAEDCDPRLKSTIWIPGDLVSQVTDAYFIRPTIDEGALQLCPTGFQVKKTANPYSPAAGQSWEIQGETGLIYLRYGEVLLNYVEAKYELEGVVAYDPLNLLRQRAGMPDFVVNSQNADPNVVYYGYSITDELYEIRRERRIEMALEGQRDEDYQRWAAHALFKGKRPKGYPVSPEEFPDYSMPLDENGLIDYYAVRLPEGYQFREGQDYLYSIPQDELTLNPNLTQNPGW